MPKRSLEISLFEKGLVTSVNPQDIDVNAMSYSENLDANVNGKLQGIPSSTVKSSTLGLGYQRGGFLHGLTGQYDLIYTDGTDIKAILDFYGSPTGSTIISGVVGKTFLREGRHFYIGTGSDSSHPTKWVGYIENQTLGGIGQLTFTGSGLDDMNVLGNYSGNANATYYIKITTTGTQDSFQWKKDSGTYSSDILMTGASQSIAEDISVYFAASTGHTTDDLFTIPVYSQVSTLQNYDAQLSTYEGDGTVDGTIKMYKSSAGSGSYLHRWRYSLIYDGVSESVLSSQYEDYLASTKGDYLDDVGAWIKNGLANGSAINHRITSINFYSAESTDTTAANLGEAKLIFSVSMVSFGAVDSNVPNFLASTGSTLSKTGADAVVFTELLTSPYVAGLSYNQNSGQQENADPVILNFTLSAEVNGSAFVANCYENSLPYADLMLFKSNPGAFGAFDIVNDSMWLGFNPVAMKAFNGKLYIWDSSHTYVVDPDGLFIQDILPGIGCSNDRSVEAIEVEQAHALVWSDANNIYLSQGSGIIPIGDSIKVPAESGAVNWQGIVNSDAIIIYDAVKQLILILISKVASTDTQVFAYHIIRKRWDYFPDFAAAVTFITGAFMGVNGETYAATSANLYNNFGSTSNRAWIYIGSELIMGLAKQPKKYYNFKIDSAGTGTITPYYSINKGSSYRGLTLPDLIQDVSGIWEKQNSIRLKLTGAVGSCYVNAIELLYRIMEGVR